MKKGCFFTSVILGTIAIGVIVYIVQTHGDKILDFGKEKLVEASFNSADEYFERLPDNLHTDSLKVLWKDVFEETKAMGFEEGLSYLSAVLLKIENVSKDSLISSVDLKSIRQFIEQYER